MFSRLLRLLPALLSVWTGSAIAAWELNFQPPATPLGREIYNLHTVIVLICVVIFIGVFAVMFYSIWKHRKSIGHKAAHFHEHTTVEVLWTLVPFLILLGMAYPATKTLIAQRDTSHPDMTIKATGYQWEWHYDYLEDGVSFYSKLATPREQILGLMPKDKNYLLEVDRPVVVPVGKRVRVLVTAGDVLHAWYVPALSVKQDAIPGFIRDAWFKADQIGTYRGQCAELCGKEHGFMPIVVEVVTEEKYKEWVAAHKSKSAEAGAPTQVAAVAAPTQAEAAPSTSKATAAAAKPGQADGKVIYDQTCQMCHAAGVAGAPKLGDKSAWAPRIAQGINVLHEHAIKGIRAMPAKGANAALSDAQVDAAVDYMVAQSK